MTDQVGEPRFDPTIQHRTRLAVVAFLSGCTEAEFGAVRDRLEMSDSTLSKTVTALEAAGYVSVRKGYVGRRPRTWLALTCEGARRLADHLAALAVVADQARSYGASLS